MASGSVPQRFTQLVTGTVSVVEFLGVAVKESIRGFASGSQFDVPRRLSSTA
jgi:hypothetical protein